MSNINSILVYLDDDMPDYMDGLIRIGSVQYFDSKGNEIEENEYEAFQITLKPDDLVDNTEYHTELELKSDVAKRLGIGIDQIEIEG
jgi:hypothetical protein